MIVNCVSVNARGPPYITYFREGLRTIIPGGKSDLGDLITLACALCENVLSRDSSRDDWIKEFIKQKLSSGLFGAGGAAE